MTLEAITRCADQGAARARQRMVLIDSGVIKPGEIQFVGDVVEIKLQLEVIVHLVGGHGIEHHVAGYPGGVLGVRIAMADRGKPSADAPRRSGFHHKLKASCGVFGAWRPTERGSLEPVTLSFK
jgi:hypothetical protein